MAQTRWWQAETLGMVFDPSGECGEEGDVLVGIGSHSLQRRATVLNHKAERQFGSGAAYSSLSEYLAQAGAATLARWRSALPEGMRSVRRLVVEDASLDTCMALLIFARLVSPDPAGETDALGAIPPLADATTKSRLAAWLQYVSQWEQGRYADGADKRASVACQMAVLSHLLLPGAGPDGRPDDTSTRRALTACLTLLDAYLELNEDPRHAVAPLGLREFQLADSQLDFECQQYQLALSYGIRTQLLLPLAGTGRKVLVDALFATDLELTGILKVLARTDTENAWTKRGFAVLGFYRPSLAGTGNDMTLSVDPLRGLSLEDLWDRLEALERERWAGQRPCDSPRWGIKKYSDADSKPKPGAPNQPWYDDQGNFTLIGAPRAVAPGVPGSKLRWYEDVLPAVWDLYSPLCFASLGVRDVRSAFGRRIRSVRWHRQEASAATRTPALHRWLATLSASQEAHHPGQFVGEADIEVVSLPGGDAVVHPGGITFFDDWTPIDLDLDALESFAHTLAGLAREYADILEGEDLKSLVNQESALLQSADHFGFRTVADLKERAIRLRAKLLELACREASIPPIRNETGIRAAIEKAWGMPQARNQLWEMLSRIDDLLSQAHTLLQEKGQFLSTAVISTAGVFVVVKEGIAVVDDWMTMNQFELTLPSWRKFGIATESPADYHAVAQQAELKSEFNAITLIAMILVFAVGLLLSALKYFGPLRRRVSKKSRTGMDKPANGIEEDILR